MTALFLNRSICAWLVFVAAALTPLRGRAGPDAALTADVTADAAQETDAAVDQSAEREAEGELAASDCEVLFGDAAQHAQNARAREKALQGVSLQSDVVEVDHFASWREPVQVEYRGLELRQTIEEPTAEFAALFRLDESLEGYGCPAGDYLLRQDDAIGESDRILAIWRDVVLVEHEAELSYLHVSGSRSPTWRMVWHSSWTMVAPPNYGKGRAAKVRRPGRRSKPHKRRGRRR